MKSRDVGLLFLLAALWGASFIYIRYAVPVLGAFTLVAARTLIAAAVLIAYAKLSGRSLDFRRYWKQYFVLGALNSAVPFVLISSAELYISAPLASILNATTPLFSALVGVLWLGDRLTLPRIAGLGLGMLGVIIVVGWESQAMTNAVLIAIGMSLVASLFYAIGSTYGKRTFKASPPVSMAIGQQLSAGILLIPLAAASPPTEPVTLSVIAAVLALAVLSTAVAYLIYFTLLSSAGPTNTLTVTFLNPFFSILWGALFLGETVGWLQFAGLLVILSGLFLVTGFRPTTLFARRSALPAQGS